MTRVYDSLMKAGKFTAAQNKANDSEYVNSVSELIMMAEKEGFIPRYYIEEPNDKVDRVLQDFQGYVKHLISDELNLGNLIEQAVFRIEQDRAKEQDHTAEAATEEEIEEEQMFAPEDDEEVADEEYSEFFDADSFDANEEE